MAAFGGVAAWALFIKPRAPRRGPPGDREQQMPIPPAPVAGRCESQRRADSAAAPEQEVAQARCARRRSPRGSAAGARSESSRRHGSGSGLSSGLGGPGPNAGPGARGRRGAHGGARSSRACVNMHKIAVKRTCWERGGGTRRRRTRRVSRHDRRQRPRHERLAEGNNPTVGELPREGDAQLGFPRDRRDGRIVDLPFHFVGPVGARGPRASRPRALSRTAIASRTNRRKVAALRAVRAPWCEPKRRAAR